MENVVISDKDGGLSTELRSPKGDIPVFLSPSGDRTIWNAVINISATGDNTIYTPAAGKKFYIQDLQLTVRAACGLILKSGSTGNLTGQMMFAANGIFNADHTAPLFSLAVSDAFVINTSGDGLKPIVGGYVTGYDE